MPHDRQDSTTGPERPAGARFDLLWAARPKRVYPPSCQSCGRPYHPDPGLPRPYRELCHDCCLRAIAHDTLVARTPFRDLQDSQEFLNLTDDEREDLVLALHAWWREHGDRGSFRATWRELIREAVGRRSQSKSGQGAASPPQTAGSLDGYIRLSEAALKYNMPKSGSSGGSDLFRFFRLKRRSSYPTSSYLVLCRL